MKDIIIGRVADILDLETIDIEVMQVVRSKNGAYNPNENVRFNIIENGLHPLKGLKNKRYIEWLIKGKGVMCLVTGRNTRGDIEADVYVLGK